MAGTKATAAEARAAVIGPYSDVASRTAAKAQSPRPERTPATARTLPDSNAFCRSLRLLLRVLLRQTDDVVSHSD
jgi:hypothetical protein